MLNACLYLLSALSLACAASLPAYRPRQAYYYNAPPASTTAALQRIVMAHMQRFYQAEQQYGQAQYAAQYTQQAPAAMRQFKPQAQLQRQPVLLQRYQTVSAAPYATSASQPSQRYALPLNTPVPKNYAQNFLPTGNDVVPGSSYIPLRLLRLIR